MVELQVGAPRLLDADWVNKAIKRFGSRFPQEDAEVIRDEWVLLSNSITDRIKTVKIAYEDIESIQTGIIRPSDLVAPTRAALVRSIEEDYDYLIVETLRIVKVAEKWDALKCKYEGEDQDETPEEE
jgi:hypothetical protein